MLTHFAGRPETLHMTRASLAGLLEIGRQDATMTLAIQINTEELVREAETEDDQYLMPDTTIMLSHQIEIAFETL